MGTASTQHQPEGGRRQGEPGQVHKERNRTLSIHR